LAGFPPAEEDAEALPLDDDVEGEAPSLLDRAKEAAQHGTCVCHEPALMRKCMEAVCQNQCENKSAEWGKRLKTHMKAALDGSEAKDATVLITGGHDTGKSTLVAWLLKLEPDSSRIMLAPSNFNSLLRLAQKPAVTLAYWNEAGWQPFKGNEQVLKSLLSHEQFQMTLPRNLLKSKEDSAVASVSKVPPLIITTNDDPAAAFDNLEGKFKRFCMAVPIPQKDCSLKAKTQNFSCTKCGADWLLTE
jgi:hypothetical protein